MSIPILGAWIAASLVVTVLILVYLARRGSSRALPDTTRGGRCGPYANAPAPQAARAPPAKTLALLGLIVSILSLISSTVIGLLDVLKK